MKTLLTHPLPLSMRTHPSSPHSGGTRFAANPSNYPYPPQDPEEKKVLKFMAKTLAIVLSLFGMTTVGWFTQKYLQRESALKQKRALQQEIQQVNEQYITLRASLLKRDLELSLQSRIINIQERAALIEQITPILLQSDPDTLEQQGKAPRIIGIQNDKGERWLTIQALSQQEQAIERMGNREFPPSSVQVLGGGFATDCKTCTWYQWSPNPETKDYRLQPVNTLRP